MSRGTIIVVDDEPNILTTVSRALELEGFDAIVASSGRAALRELGRRTPDLALLDVAMPQMDGLELLEALRRDLPDLPVIMMSGHSTIETAVRATKLGAFDFIEKPLSSDRLLLSIDNALKLRRLREENAALRAQAGGLQMIGDSRAMKDVFAIIGKTAPTRARVLITGENGTGKELVARAIHDGSPRADEPFIKVNCAAIPQELIESELFGHEKGAFTGATRLRKGKFELAHRGTLFLDEIGDMSSGAQAKVLRALQEGEVERVGGSETLRVDVRVVAATNKRMQEEIEAGRFREDLYYRLNVVPIELPPLRGRREDIPALAEHFLEEACRLHGKRAKTLAQEAISSLMQHDWPGNVRELKNSIERLVILGDGDAITAEQVRGLLPATRSAGSHYRRGAALRDMVAAAERDLIVSALRDHDGRVAPTADALQLERSHLYKKMKLLGIDHRAVATDSD